MTTKKTYELYSESKTLKVEEEIYNLSFLEFKLLYLFFENKNNIVTMEDIAALSDKKAKVTNIRTRVYNLRNKYDIKIISRSGFGYQLDCDKKEYIITQKQKNML